MAKTLAEQIAAAEARLAKLIAQRDSEAVFANIAVGAAVAFKFGRKENRQELEGVVKGVRTDEKGVKWAAVFVASDDGFGDNTYKIRVSEITRMVGDDAAVEATSDEVASDDADPLNAA